MANIIYTQRLMLLKMGTDYLKSYLNHPAKLEQRLGYCLSRDVITERTRQAIKTNLTKMRDVNPIQHVWLTFWLMVTLDPKYGAGLVGFTGFPDENGEAEIGFGIDPAHQNKGYTTEAIQALIQWAFKEPSCYSVVSRDTKKNNLASNRLLEKVGMYVYYESDDSLYWRIDRSPNLIGMKINDPIKQEETYLRG